MQSPVSRWRLFIPAAVALLLTAGSPRIASADVCVTIDETRDMFSDQERIGALNLLERQFELEGERVVPAGCTEAYAVYHIRFGSRISITLSGPKGRRDATAVDMDDVPAVYSQMVRSLVKGVPMQATGIVDRGNVSGTQTEPQRRVHSDLVYYARLGYGVMFGDQAYGGPSMGFLGFRREGERFGVDLSFFNFQYKSSDHSSYYGYPAQGTSGQTGSWLKMQVMRYFKPSADRSPYLAGGLSFGSVNLTHDNTSYEGNGLQGDLTVGYETGRAGSIHVFVQTDVGLPFYELSATTYPTAYPTTPPYIYSPVTSHRYVPSLTVSLGVGWQRGGK
jgi:hypothetical protein